MTKEIVKAGSVGVDTLNLTEAVRVAEFAQLDMDSAWSQVQQIQKLKNEASFRGLRAGCALVAIKLLLPHGDFLPFCEKHFTEATPRHLQRLMSLAEQFCEEKQIEAGMAFAEMIKIDASSVIGIAEAPRKALSDGKDKKAVIEGGFPQLVFGFIGGDSLRELLGRYGIMQPSTGKKQKSLPPARPLTHADKVQTYTEAWKETAAQLNEQGLRQKTWTVVDHITLSNVARTLEDLARMMRADIAKQAAREKKRK